MAHSMVIANDNNGEGGAPPSRAGMINDGGRRAREAWYINEGSYISKQTRKNKVTYSRQCRGSLGGRNAGTCNWLADKGTEW